MSQIKEAIELLLDYKARCYAGPGKEQFKGRERINQALAKLSTEQPPAGELTRKIRQLAKLNFESHNYGEKIIAHIDRNLIYDLCARLDRSEAGERILEERIEKLSDTLDRSEESRKDLLDALSHIKDVLEAARARPTEIALDWEKLLASFTEAAITKEKEVKK